MTGWVLSLAFLLCSAGAEPSAVREAKAHFERGLRAYDLQDYQEAISEYRSAYRLDPQPRYIFNLAQAERLAGNCKSAIQYYKTFLRSAPAPTWAQVARQNIEACQRELAKPPPEQPKEETPAPAPVPAAKAAPPALVPSPPPPLAPAANVMKPERPFYSDPLGDTLLLSGLAAASVGTVLYLQGKGAVQTANAAPTLQQYLAVPKSAEGKQGWGVGLMAGGAALLAGGIVRYVAFSAGQRQLSVSASASGEGLGVALRGTF